MNRSFLSLCAAFIAHTTIVAQAPNAFNYQAIARDLAGDEITNQSIGVEFKLHQTTALGTIVYSESHTPATNEHGLFSVAVGNGTPGSGSFDAIDWKSGPYFLEVGLDVSGGTNYLVVGTQQLLSVPYALHAGSVDCQTVSLIGDTVFQGNGCYLILPGASAANGGCADIDGDGFFDQAGCGTALDCDDSAYGINPDATEICDGVDNDCNGFIDDVNPPANAGSDQHFCTPTSLTNLFANAAIGGDIGTWTVISGTALFNDVNDPNTQVSGFSIGVNIYQWTIYHGPCGITSDEVSIFLFDGNASIADAGPDQEFCTPVTSTNMGANTASYPATGTWTLIAGTAVLADPNNPNTFVSGLSIGESLFEWEISNGPCLNSITTDLVSIFVFDQNAPAADAGPDQVIFVPSTTTTLTANGSVYPGVGTWSVISGTGLFLDPNEELTVVTGLSLGENVFQWSIDNGPCAAPTVDQVSIFLLDQQ